jgi:ferredoxin--NADP+ reductase
MYEILEKKLIAPQIYKMKIYAPLAVKNAKPGQFVVVIPKKNGERIPLTIFSYENKNLIIIFQVVGHTTKVLSEMEVKEKLEAVLGPLGTPAEIDKFGTVLCVGGGVGTVVLYPEIKALKEKGNKIYSVIGAKEKSLVILENEIKSFSDKIFVTTDDGSYGEKGVVTLPVQRLLETEKIDRVIAIGPVIMMKKVCELTKKYNIKTIVSLNPIMVDATGMCGACRVEIDGKTCFACVHGPEFDGHKVNFDLLIHRNSQFVELEKKSYEK